MYDALIKRGYLVEQGDDLSLSASGEASFQTLVFHCHRLTRAVGPYVGNALIGARGARIWRAL